MRPCVSAPRGCFVRVVDLVALFGARSVAVAAWPAVHQRITRIASSPVTWRLRINSQMLLVVSRQGRAWGFRRRLILNSLLGALDLTSGRRLAVLVLSFVAVIVAHMVLSALPIFLGLSVSGNHQLVNCFDRKRSESLFSCTLHQLFKTVDAE